jgi:starch synthase
MKVLFVSSEVVPFAKTGSLADVAGALPPALKELGAEVSIIMPRYRRMERASHDLKVCGEATVSDPGGEVTVRFKKANLPGGRIPVYFVDYPLYFGRDNLYGYDDDCIRFTLFSKAVYEFLCSCRPSFDIVHCNDWQSALVPLYLKTRGDIRAGVVFTIHNLNSQGQFNSENLDMLDVNPHLFHATAPLEFYGRINLMKAAVFFSDIITTVSERYAREIQTPRFGEGLDGVLRSRTPDLFGVLNGIDTDLWNPGEDPFIAKKYSLMTLEDKEENKKDLLKHFSLRYRKGVPLIGMISKLTGQKGFDLLAERRKEILSGDLQMIVLGQGEAKYRDMLASLSVSHPEKLAVKFDFDDELAHKIEAGADFLLMPSRFEPCGLNQQYSLRYGTIPIVHETGGLADTIVDVTRNAIVGNGFSFAEYSGDALMDAIRRALALYAEGPAWLNLKRRAMTAELSWKESARKYMELYRSVLARQ